MIKRYTPGNCDYDEPDDEPAATEPSLIAQDRAEDLLCQFVADHPPQTAVIELARELERFAAEAGPPWLSDAAEALGLVRPSDGAPLALNWTQVLNEIRDQRDQLSESRLDLKRLLGDDGMRDGAIAVLPAPLRGSARGQRT